MGMSPDMSLSLGSAGANLYAQVLALNPQVLFDISVANTLYQERTGASATTPSAVGDPVGSLKNLGTAGGWAVAPSDLARPTLRSSGGLYWLETDGSNDRMTISITATAGITAALALNVDTLVNGAASMELRATSRNDFSMELPQARTGPDLLWWGYTGAAFSTQANTTESTSLTAKRVASFRAETNNTIIRVNAVEIGADTSCVWTPANVLFLELGLGGAASDSNIYAAAYFDAFLTTAQNAVLESYLAQKIGVTL